MVVRWIMTWTWHEGIASAAYRLRNRLRDWGFDVGRAYAERSPGAFFMMHILPKVGVDVVVDVGARQGEFGRSIRHSGYSGPIVSFEPVPSNLETLRRVSDHDALWHVYPYALGSADGEATIRVARYSALSSLLVATAPLRQQFGSSADVVDTVEVPVRRLDGLLPPIIRQLGLTDPNIFLKVDTQGYDLEVIRGAKGILGHVPACQVEVAFEKTYEGAPDFLEIFTFMRSLGFGLAALFRVAYSDRLALSEADAFFIRTAPEG